MPAIRDLRGRPVSTESVSPQHRRPAMMEESSDSQDIAAVKAGLKELQSKRATDPSKSGLDEAEVRSALAHRIAMPTVPFSTVPMPTTADVVQTNVIVNVIIAKASALIGLCEEIVSLGEKLKVANALERKKYDKIIALADELKPMVYEPGGKG